MRRGRRVRGGGGGGGQKGFLKNSTYLVRIDVGFSIRVVLGLGDGAGGGEGWGVGGGVG